MADIMTIMIRYEAPYSRDSLETVLRAVETAVTENWDDHDEWSSPHASLSVDVEAWLKAFAPERLMWDDHHQEWRPRSEGATTARATEFFFAFSPISCKTLSIAPTKARDEALVVECLIYASVLYELQGDREANRMEVIWDGIRKARGEKEPRTTGPDGDSPEFEDWWDKKAALDETFSAWPCVKAHLRHVIDALRAALPVRNAKIDPRLLSPIPAPVTDEALRGRRDLFRGG